MLPTGLAAILHHPFVSWCHLLWLYFLANPLVVYIQGPAKISVVVPVLLTILIGRTVRFPVSHWRFVLFWMMAGIGISFVTAYWTPLGLHFFNPSQIVFPVAVWIFGWRFFSPWWAAILTFWNNLIPDFCMAGIHQNWVQNFWFGVGGAGLHDALFLSTVTTLIAALILSWFQQGKELVKRSPEWHLS